MDARVHSSWKSSEYGNIRDGLVHRGRQVSSDSNHLWTTRLLRFDTQCVVVLDTTARELGLPTTPLCAPLLASHLTEAMQAVHLDGRIREVSNRLGAELGTGILGLLLSGGS